MIDDKIIEILASSFNRMPDEKCHLRIVQTLDWSGQSMVCFFFFLELEQSEMHKSF